MIQLTDKYTKYAYASCVTAAHESCLVELPAQGYTHFPPSSILVKMVSIGI